MDEEYILQRRAAFWNRWRLFLQEDIERINTDSAAKPFEDDQSDIENVINLLKEAELITMKKFASVLLAQIAARSSDNGKEIIS